VLTQGPLRPIYICGSTATGKTAVSIALANAIDGEIVNADAYQVYRGLDAITAAPNAEELSQAPHHLFGILEPTQDFDAQRFIDIAKPTITAIQERGNIPIVVGGSGMYLKFLTHGPSPVPPSDAKVRAELESRSDNDLIAELQRRDPEGAAQTNLKNRRYVIRALEICLLSGQAMSSIKNDWKQSNQETEKHLRGFLLDWDRNILRSRIQLRTQRMLAGSAIDEVASHAELSATCEKAIGINHIRSYLEGAISLERCTELIYFATCQYAKRQRSWFQREHWITPIPMNPETTPENVVQQIFSLLECD